jgi:hypothetical protein
MKRVLNKYIYLYGLVTGWGSYLSQRPAKNIVFVYLLVYNFNLLYFKCELNTVQCTLFLSEFSFRLEVLNGNGILHYFVNVRITFVNIHIFCRDESLYNKCICITYIKQVCGAVWRRSVGITATIQVHYFI